MEVFINAIVPIFLVVLLGWLMTYFKLVPTDVAGSLMQYVFNAAAPAIIIWALSRQLLVWRFWLAFMLVFLIVLLLTFCLFRYGLRREGYWSIVAGMGAASPNVVLIGFPVLASLVGTRATIPMVIVVIIFAVFATPLLLLILEIRQSQSMSKKQFTVLFSALKNTCKNPVMIGALIGILLSVFDIKLPFILEHFLRMVGFSMIPCALFAVGLELRHFTAKGNLLDVSLITLLNLIVTPLLAILIAKLLGLSPFYAVSLVVLTAVPTAKLIYVYVSRYKAYTAEIAAVVSVTTVISIVTIPFYVYIAELIWPTLVHFIG